MKKNRRSSILGLALIALSSAGTAASAAVDWVEPPVNLTQIREAAQNAPGVKSAAYYCNGQQQTLAGDIYYPNGQRLQLAGDLYYPTGRQVTLAGELFYPNGQRYFFARDQYYMNEQRVQVAGDFYYPNGRRVKIAGDCYWSTGIQMPSCPQTVKYIYRVDGVVVRGTLDLEKGLLESILFEIPGKGYTTYFELDPQSGTISNIEAVCDC